MIDSAIKPHIAQDLILASSREKSCLPILHTHDTVVIAKTCLQADNLDPHKTGPTCLRGNQQGGMLLQYPSVGVTGHLGLRIC